MLHKKRIFTIGMISLCMFFSQTMMYPIQAVAKNTTSPQEDVSISFIGDGQRSVNFDKNWKFFKGDVKGAEKQDFNDAQWRSLDLPHDYSIESDFTTKGEAESGFLLGGIGWYRKHQVIPKKYEGKQITINFDGVYMNAEIYVNGKKLGIHPYGYTSFSFDISPYLVYDGTTDNVIAVRVDNEVPSSRWYSGSGIYRDVSITVTDPIHIAQDGETITTPNLEKEKHGLVQVATKTRVRNDSNTAANLVVKQSVIDNKGGVVSAPDQTTISLDKQGKKDVLLQLFVKQPALWSVKSPTMYQVKTEIIKDGNVIDTLVSAFGFRYFAFDRDSGFSLNGEKMKLNGVSMHHDQGALGAVANKRAIQRQVEKLKAMGANAIRVTHNPASSALLDVANHEGMLLIDEAFDGWASPKNGNVNDFSSHFNEKIGSDNAILNGQADMTWAEFDIKTMVTHAQNDPSVIMWSIGNEITEGSQDDGHYIDYAKNLISWVQSEDTTRPVTMGDNHSKDGTKLYHDISSLLADHGGVVGLNYSSEKVYKDLYQQNPNWKIYGSETSSALRSRGVYYTKGQDKDTMQLSAYDSIAVGWGELASSSMKAVLSNDFISGEFVWTGFDYIGEPTPYNGTGQGTVSGNGPSPKSSYFGIFDTAGFKKDVYYLYQSQWNQDVTTLHVLPTWNEENMVKDASGNVEVDVYSNAPQVELFLNNISLGKKQMVKHTTAAGHSYVSDANGNMFLKYNVPYKKGTLRAVAYDKIGNVIKNTSGRNEVTTSGTAAALALQADRSNIQADGKDLSYIRVDVKDAADNPVSYANNKINFSIVGDGKIVGVDNGDPTDIDSYKASSRKAFSGKALVIVQSSQKAGSFTITAKSDGLKGASVKVDTQKVESDATYMESYKIAKHIYVGLHEKPQLPDQVPVTFSNGDVKSYAVKWDGYDESAIEKPETFQVRGVLEGSDVNVFVQVHVLGNIVDVVQPSLFMNAKETLVLPKTIQGITEDGTLSNDFSVIWDQVAADAYAQEGTFFVKGVAQVLDKQLPVTASVRVGKPIKGPVNIADKAYRDAPIRSESTKTPSDNLQSINNGITNDSVNINERWTNWSDRLLNEEAYITMDWKQPHTINKVNLWLFTDNNVASLPKKVDFEYNDGITWIPIPVTSTTPVSYLSGETTYLFDKPVKMQKLRIGLLEQPGKCIGLTEAKVYSYSPIEQSHQSASLQSISLNGLPIANFNSMQKEYTIPLQKADPIYPKVTAQSLDNAGVTVLPVYQDKTKIIVSSEDGKTLTTYSLTYQLPVDVRKLQTVYEQGAAMLIKKDQYINNDAWKQLITILTQAKEMLSNPISQTDMDALYNRLLKSMDHVSYVLGQGSREQKMLQGYIDKAFVIKQEAYSNEDYAFIQKVTKEVAAILNAKAYTKVQMKQAQEDIAKAMDSIHHHKLPSILKVDKTALEKTIRQASAISLQGYQEKTVQNFRDNLQHAADVLKDPKALQSDVDLANQMLLTNMHNLEKTKVVLTKQVRVIKNVNTGDSTKSYRILWICVSLSGMLLLFVGYRKRRHKKS